MAVKKITEIVEGRGFGTGTTYDGMMKRVKEFLVTTVGWTLTYDNSADVTYPEIVVSNKATVNENDPDQIFVGIGFPISESGRVRVRSYLSSDGANNFGINFSDDYLTTFDSAEFELHARSNTEKTFINITVKAGSTYSTAHVDKLDTSFSTLGNTSTASITSYTREADVNTATIEMTDASAYTVGEQYMLVDEATNTVLQVYADVVDTISTPNSVLVSTVKPTIIDMPATLTVGTLFGKYPHKFCEYVVKSNSSIRVRNLPYVYRTPGTAVDPDVIKNVEMSQELYIEDSSFPRAVYTPGLYLDEATNNYSEYFYGNVTNLLRGDGFGTELSTGITIGATNYVLVSKQDSDLFVEDGTV